MVGHSGGGGIEIKIIARRYFFFSKLDSIRSIEDSVFFNLSGIVINKFIKPDADVRL